MLFLTPLTSHLTPAPTSGCPGAHSIPVGCAQPIVYPETGGLGTSNKISPKDCSIIHRCIERKEGGGKEKLKS